MSTQIRNGKEQGSIFLPFLYFCKKQKLQATQHTESLDVDLSWCIMSGTAAARIKMVVIAIAAHLKEISKEEKSFLSRSMYSQISDGMWSNNPFKYGVTTYA